MITALAMLVLLQQDIPEKPEDLKYRPLKFDVPDAASMRVELPGGTVVYILEDRSLPKVDLTVLVRAGSFWVPAGKEGVAGFCGALMRTGGTTSRKPAALDDELDYLAAELGVSVGDTSGSATLSVLSKDLDKGLEILFDVLRNPAFDQEKLDLLKQQTMKQLESRNDRPQSIEGRELSLLLYGHFPVNRHATGASVTSITREDLIAYHGKSFHPANFIIAAAGDFAKDELLAKLKDGLKGWPAGEARPAIPRVAHQPEPGIYGFQKDVPQGSVTIAHLGIDVSHPDAYAVRLLSYILGGGSFSSRLVQKVRTEMGLAYSVYSDFSPGRLYTGTMRMAFQTKSATCALAAKTCLDELEKMRTELVGDDELASAKQYYVDAFPSVFSTAAGTVGTFATAEMNGLARDYYAKFLGRMTAVTRDDIRRAAKELVRPEKFVIVMVGDLAAIQKGDAKAKLADLGRPFTEVALPDPVTLERPTPKKRELKNGFCEACAGKAYTSDTKQCGCGGWTGSGAFKMCAKCAEKAGVCQACGK